MSNGEVPGPPKLSERPGTVLAGGAILLILLNSTWFSATAVIGQAYPVWHISQSSSAWISIAVQWGFALGALLASIIGLADSLRPQTLIMISSIGASFANLSLIYIHSPGSAIAARALTGFFVAGIYPPWIKLISTWYRVNRGMAVGILVGALNVGEGLPFIVNALGGLDWHMVILVTSAATIVGGLITSIFVREGPYSFAQGRLDLRQIGRVVKGKRTQFAALGYIGHMWELYAALTWFLPFMENMLPRHGLGDPSTASYVTFAVFVAGGIATWTCGSMGDRLGREEVAISMMALSAGCCLLIGPLAGSPWWLFMPLALVWGYSIIGDSVQFSALATEYAPSDCVGTALTLQMAAGFFLSGVTIWLIPVIRSALGWEWTFSVLAIGPLAGIVAMQRSIHVRRGITPDSLAESSEPASSAQSSRGASF